MGHFLHQRKIGAYTAKNPTIIHYHIFSEILSEGTVFDNKNRCFQQPAEIDGYVINIGLHAVHVFEKLAKDYQDFLQQKDNPQNIIPSNAGLKTPHIQKEEEL